MSDTQLELIRAYFDTSGMRLNQREKDVICMILQDPSRYDGFESQIYESHDSGRDYRDTWNSESNWQYRIHVGTECYIEEIFRHECDGYVQDAHWDWNNAKKITDLRDIIAILNEIRSEL